jgi:phosphate starvation-inducible PhoH-like protein
MGDVGEDFNALKKYRKEKIMKRKFIGGKEFDNLITGNEYFIDKNLANGEYYVHGEKGRVAYLKKEHKWINILNQTEVDMTTENHKLYGQFLFSRNSNTVLAIGSAGTGKTCGAIKLAIDWIKRGRKVVITRPAVSFADKNGFLPGSAREKMEPWIIPIRQNFKYHQIGRELHDKWEVQGAIEYMLLEHAQGVTLDDTLFIIDECQNIKFEELKIILTRGGNNSKIVMCGDVNQVSPRFAGSGLAELVDMAKTLYLPVSIVEFGLDDIVRGETCKMYIEAFEQWEELRGG